MRKDNEKAVRLKRDFGCAIVEPIHKGVFKATLPNIFYLRDVNPFLSRLPLCKEKVVLEQPYGIGLDQRHALRALFDGIQMRGIAALHSYLPKAEQDENVVRHGQVYEMFDNKRLHHDDDPALYDFVRFTHEDQKIKKESFGLRHFHLRRLCR